MPTYTVFASAGVLDASKKAQLARDITAAHSRVTGAQSFFAQVVFREVGDGDWFMGGAPLEGRQVYCIGHVRGGRPDAMMRSLIEALRVAVTEGAGVARHEVWVYVVDLPPARMVEYGHVLPEPGQEGRWLDDMPANDRARLESLGRQR